MSDTISLRPSSMPAPRAPGSGFTHELSMGFPVRIYGNSGSGAAFPAIIRVPSKLDDRGAA